MKMRSLVNHGLDIEELNTDECFSPRPNIGRSFRFTHAGHSYRITELEAAIGLAQLEDYRNIIKGRRRNANHLKAKLRLINEAHEANFFLPEIAGGNEHAWMMFPIVCDPKRSPKDKLVPFLNENGVETRDMMPIVRQPIYEEMLNPNHYPVALWTNDNGFYVGCHQDIQPSDVEYMAQVITDFFVQ
jgi:CDP-6-deoxy-D-xylo-4-hexulose-3-dehydrase